MFVQFYGFETVPFSNDVAAGNLFVSDRQQEALSRLNYAVSDKKFMVLSGECGTGKTTVLRQFFDSLDESRSVPLYFAESRLKPRHFYGALQNLLGRDGFSSRGDPRRRLHELVEYTRHVRNRELIVVVDEAHLLGKDMLEEIRFILNFKMDSVSPMTLILSGQPELTQRIDARSCAAIRQRIDVRFRLLPLNLDEAVGYISHHLNLAGSTGDIFTGAAMKEIHMFSGGLIRVINKVCVNCLLFGAAKSKKLIDDHMVKAVIESEMQ
jgi:type II secretory pathway predicted ATPase ExeA